MGSHTQIMQPDGARVRPFLPRDREVVVQVENLQQVDSVADIRRQAKRCIRRANHLVQLIYCELPVAIGIEPVRVMHKSLECGRWLKGVSGTRQ